LPARDQSVRYRRRHRGHGVFVSSGEVGVARILWVAADLVPDEINLGYPIRPSRWLTIAGARPVQYTGTRRPQEKKKKRVAAQP